MSVAVGVTRLSGRALAAAVGLALGLMCSVLALAAATTPMADMTDASGGSAIVGTGVSPAAIAAGPAVGDLVADAEPVMASMCDHACVTDVSDACSFAAGLTVITLLGLLLACRRNTFMGSLTRTRPSALARRPRRERTPRTALPRFSLCVLRV